MKLTLSELAALFPNSTLAAPGDTRLFGMTQDTRRIQPGELYVAIKGDNFDGHDFVSQAFDKGAIAALVSDPKVKLLDCFFCDDTVQGLAKIASYYRGKFKQPVIAITGSSGKTTNKEFLAHVLKLSGPVIATQGNLNNHIGVPLTIARFIPEAKAFVVEMGMNHPEEIRHLARIARPTIALIIGVGHAHMEGCGGTIEGVAKAKGELFEELDAAALAVVNADDKLVSALPTKARRITFGLSQNADVRAEDIAVAADRTRFTIATKKVRLPVEIRMVGNHHVRNALAVYTIASYLGMSDDEIRSGLESFHIAMNRGRVMSKGRVSLVDDTYNANPDSMHAAFESLALQFPSACKIGALGGMLELGPDATDLHRRVGIDAKAAGLDEIFAYGGESRATLEGFGYSAEEIQQRLFPNQESLAQAVNARLGATGEAVAILFKGSRGMQMEKALTKVWEALE